MPDFSRRATTTELMDSAPCSFDDYRNCLRDLERVNRLTLAYRPTLRFLDRLAKEGRLPRERAARIVDFGCGSGDMLRRIDSWARRRGIAAELTGVDHDPRALRVAAEESPAGCPVRWIEAECLSYRPAATVDVAVSSLFAHHLDDGALIRFIARMEEMAAVGWFINDLQRHRLTWFGFGVWSRAAGWHRFVRHDGPVSIARAFRRAEWQRYLANAGIPCGETMISWTVPFRLCVARVRAP